MVNLPLTLWGNRNTWHSEIYSRETTPWKKNVFVSIYTSLLNLKVLLRYGIQIFHQTIQISHFCWKFLSTFWLLYVWIYSGLQHDVRSFGLYNRYGTGFDWSRGERRPGLFIGRLLGLDYLMFWGAMVMNPWEEIWLVMGVWGCEASHWSVSSGQTAVAVELVLSWRNDGHWLALT